MKYPPIERLEDLFPAIEGMPEFVVSRRGPVTAVDYVFQTEATFQPRPGEDPRMAALRRECRGVKFDAKDGRVVARPYAKFFNLNQVEETRVECLEWTAPFVALEKLDGSMVHSAPVEGRIAFMTTLGETRVSRQAAEHATSCGLPYARFCAEAHADGWTPIFEWCSKRQRIVVGYPEDALVLTALRRTREGEYMPYGRMVEEAATAGIPVVGTLFVPTGPPEALVAAVRALTEGEGTVLRFDDGFMVKLKADRYVRVHAAIEALKREKDVVAMILAGTEDDVIPVLAMDDAAALATFARVVREGLAAKAADIARRASEGLASTGGDRGRFAREVAATVDKLDRTLLFHAAKGGDPLTALRAMVAAECATAVRLERVRSCWGGRRWQDFFNAERFASG